MCVIIFIKKGQTVSEEELKNAWRTNSDGAGYSVQIKHNGKDVVKFHRGFMTFKPFYKAISQYMGSHNLMLHFRITTSNKVNQMQTHPYKKSDIKALYGFTEQPVIAMNGIISDQAIYKGFNDTMSYIVDHQGAFKVINQDIINIIADATNCRWAAMLPDQVLLSDNFIEEEGIYYSNLNHKTVYNYLKCYPKRQSMRDLIKSKKLRKQIQKDKTLYINLLDFIDFNCNSDYYHCIYCEKCLKSCKTIHDVKDKLYTEYYY